MSKSSKNQIEETLQLGSYPNIHWKKFFDKFIDIETLNIKDWKVAHILSYFAKQYKLYYETDYTFRFNSNAPGKSYEVFQINKLGQMLSIDPVILVAYIDWFFDNKLKERKKKITSMAFLTDVNVINEYKNNYLMLNKNSNIDRTTILPPNYKEIVSKFSNVISTYGDLAFAIKCGEYEEMLKELCIAGMNVSALDKVK